MAERQQTVLITGKGGIGHALAQEFYSRGFRVFATARQAESIGDLAAAGMDTLSLELQQPGQIRAARQEVERRTAGAGLDYLVNNAGRGHVVPALDVDMDEARQTFDVNVFAVMRMCQEFAPLLIQGRGTIVQIGSISAVTPLVFGSVYNASKAALHVYSDTLRVELAPLGVRVITVVTGGVVSNIARADRRLPAHSLYLPIDSQYQRRVKYSQHDSMPTADYARSVVASVTRPRCRKQVWEGRMAWILWTIYTFLPVGAWDLIISRMFKLATLRKPPSGKQDGKKDT